MVAIKEYEVLKVRQPDFGNLLAVLGRKRPERPTLFEFFLNDRLIGLLSGSEVSGLSGNERYKAELDAFIRAGYDYLTVKLDGFEFYHNKREAGASMQMSGNGCISNWEDFRQYKWPDPADADTEMLDMKWYGGCPDGVKLIVYGPGGILENAVDILGYDQLCYMLYDEPELLEMLFEKLGSLFFGYYAHAAGHPNVGAIIYNDDWGYKTQTMVSPETLRKYVFPWVGKIVDLAHAHNKPVILHSCGKLDSVMEEIIGMGFDAKHSFEDTILPVEMAYKLYHDRIAIMGGIDVDFICRASPEEITRRCIAMLKLSEEYGGYALGTGNSVPEYVPDDHYLAMLAAVGITGIDK